MPTSPKELDELCANCGHCKRWHSARIVSGERVRADCNDATCDCTLFCPSGKMAGEQTLPVDETNS